MWLFARLLRLCLDALTTFSIKAVFPRKPVSILDSPTTLSNFTSFPIEVPCRWHQNRSEREEGIHQKEGKGRNTRIQEKYKTTEKEQTKEMITVAPKKETRNQSRSKKKEVRRQELKVGRKERQV